MKKTVLIYGLIAGAIVSAMLLISQPLFRSGQLDHNSGFAVGITSMILAMTLIYFGVRSFRDQHLNGIITFKKAFIVGLLIATTASLMYAITWEFIINFMSPDFAEWYNKMQMEELVKKGASEAEMTKAKEEMAQFATTYANPVYRFGFTLLEIFPVGLIFTLASAAILKRQPQ